MLPENAPSASGSIVSMIGRLERIPHAHEGLSPNVQRFVDHHSGVSVSRVGSAAVIRVDGPLMNDPSWMWEGFGAITYTQLAAAIDTQTADRGIATIAFDIHSPGGGVAGFTDVQAAIRRAKAAGKRVVAYVHDMAASMAAWLAALCDEIVSSPLGQIGHVGIIAMVYDSSELYAKAGVKARPIASSGDKAVGHPGVAITPEWEAMMQRGVDEIYGLMVADVAAGRRMTPEAVRGLKAGIFAAAEAVRIGMVDRIETPDAFAARVGATPLPAPKGATTLPAPHGGGKDRTMEDLKTLTLPDLKAQRADLVTAIEGEARARLEQDLAGKAKEPATFSQLEGLFGADTAGIVAAQKSKLTLDAARTAHTEALQAKLAASEKQVGELTAKVADLEKKGGKGPGADPVPEGNKPGDAPNGKHPFQAAFEKLAADTKVPLHVAMLQMERKDPKGHADFVKSGQAKK